MQGDHPMKTVTTIGIDLAKNSFSVYGVDAKGKPVLSRTLSRSQAARQTLTESKSTQGCQERRDGKTVGPAFGKPEIAQGAMTPM